MKRYLLFGFDTYEPLGGWNDLIGQYDLMIEVKTVLQTLYNLKKFYHYQIVSNGILLQLSGDEVKEWLDDETYIPNRS